MNERRAFWGAVLAAGPIYLSLILIMVGVAIRNYPVAYLAAPLLLYTVGVAAFLRAKFSLLAAGRLFTLGPTLMTPSNRRLYKLGYLFMAIGAGLTLLYRLA